jgi:hypothetical protein
MQNLVARAAPIQSIGVQCVAPYAPQAALGWTPLLENTMQFNCPVCEQSLGSDTGVNSPEIQCPSCGRYIPNPFIRLAPPPRIHLPHQYTSPSPSPPPFAPQQVVITDIKMSIPAIMIFMLKWIVASIPVILICAILYFIVFSLLLGGCAAMLLGAK